MMSEAPAVPWNERDVLLGMAAAAILVAGAVGLLIALGPEDLDLSVIAGPMELLLLPPVAWLTLRKDRAPWRALGFRSFPARVLLLGIGLFAAVYAFNFLYAVLLAQFGLSAQGDLLVELARTTSPPLVFLGVGLAAPFAEEVFFRGFLYTGLERRLGPSRSGWISALLFALAHAAPLSMPPVFLMGLAFVYLFRRTRSIWPSILLHAANNAFAFAVTMLLARSRALGG